MKCLVYFLIIITIVYSRIVIDHEIDNSLMSFLKYLIDSMKGSYDSGFIAVAYKNDYDLSADYLLKMINIEYDKKIIVFNMDSNSIENDIENMIKSDQYLGYLKLFYIFTDTTETIPSIINTTIKTKFYNCRTKIVITLNRTPTEKQIEELFKNLWVIKILNVIVTYNEKNLQIYTYNPFLDKHLERIPINSSINEIFYTKFRNMNGRKLRYLVLKEDDYSKSWYRVMNDGSRYYFGPEISLFRHITKYLNASMSITSPDEFLKDERNPWRQANSNESVAGAKSKILKEAQIDMMTSEEVIIGDNLKGATETLYPHDKEDMFIAVKKAGKLPHYLYVSLIFKIEIWYSFLITLLIGTISWVIIGSDIYHSVCNKFINILRMTTGGSLPDISKKNSERIFIIFWLIYSLIIVTAFTSNLASVLMNEKSEKNIDTLDELNESGLIIVGYQTQINELRKAFNNTPKYDLFKRMQLIPKEYDQPDVRKNKNYSYLVTEVAQVNPIIVPQGKALYVMRVPLFGSLIHIVKESPLPNYLAFLVPLNSPYIDFLNVFVRRVIEGDLMNVWRKEYMQIHIMTGGAKPLEWFNQVEDIKPLNLNHFQAAYFILAIGILLSTIAFISEVIVNKYIEWYRKRA